MAQAAVGARRCACQAAVLSSGPLDRAVVVADLIGVRIQNAEGRAGGFALDRFVGRRLAWRRRLWWAFPLVLVLPIAIELPIALLAHAPHSGLWAGVGIGAGLGAVMVLFDSPPAHIENWRTGAEGEKATARRLRPLLKQGWTLFNDIETAHGNIDHVLVGPGGVFMLESKRLSGMVRVEPGKLVVRWHEDPDDGYQNDSIDTRARGAAFDLHSRLRRAGIDLWVQAVVVIWADFAQRSIERDKVAWVRGDQLAAVLAARPRRYTDERIKELTLATRAALESLRLDAHTSRTVRGQLAGVGHRAS